MSPAIETLGGTHRDAIIEILCASFHDYPVMRYILGDDARTYDHRLRTFVGFACDGRLLRGLPILGLRAAGELVGVALVNDPVQRPRPAALDREFERLVDTLGDQEMARLDRYDRASSHAFIEESHHYLGMLGVSPEHHGRGHGTRLVEAVKALAAEDGDSIGVCLNTEVPSNVAYYEKLGFEVVREADADELHTWCMFARVG